MLLLTTALAAPPSTSGAIGTAGPVYALAAGADASWVVYCQARTDTDGDGELRVDAVRGGTRGDAQSAWLSIGTGLGAPLDDVVALDPSGRRIVVVVEGRTLLLRPGHRGIDLSARGFTGGFVEFDAAGERLLYRRGDRVVLRTLATGVERELDPGPNDGVYGAVLDAAGAWARVEVRRPGAGPYRVEPDFEGTRACETGTYSDAFRSFGDPPAVRWVPIAGGAAREAPDLLWVSGRHLLRRGPDGAIRIESAEAEFQGGRADPPPGPPLPQDSGALASSGSVEFPLVPASCGAVTLGVRPAEEALVVACTREGSPAPVREYRIGQVRDLGVTSARGSDRMDTLGRHLLLTGDIGTTIVDLDVGGGTTDPRRLTLAELDGDRSYALSEGDELVRIDTGGVATLGTVTRYGTHLRAGRYLFLAPCLVDLDAGEVSGTLGSVSVPGWEDLALGLEAYALSTDGRLLVASIPSVTGGLPLGPLRWVRP